MRRYFRFALVVSFTGVPIVAFAGGDDAEPDTDATDDLSTSNTAFAGARLLHFDETFTLGDIELVDPAADLSATVHAEGDTVFADLLSTSTGNRVGLVMEAFWFMSSLDRESDDYVLVVKINTSPDVAGDWGLVTEQSTTDQWMHGNHEVAQNMIANAPDDGSLGSVRWDWSLPFQSYRWEPSRVIEIEEEFSAGLEAKGSFMKDLTQGLPIQVKGSIEADYRATTNYTVTLYKWEMRVSTSAQDMEWGLVPLDPDRVTDNAYHEYFIVLQGDRDTTVGLDSLQFGGDFRSYNPIWFDGFETLDARIRDLRLTAPPIDELCDDDESLVGTECVTLDGDPDGGEDERECEVNSHCSDGTYCSDGACVYDCLEEIDCPSGQSCDSRGRCGFSGDENCSFGSCDDDDDDDGDGAQPASEGGCAMGGGPDAPPLAFALLGLALALFASRRRR